MNTPVAKGTMQCEIRIAIDYDHKSEELVAYLMQQAETQQEDKIVRLV
jgi:hypothetical protein